MAPVGPWGLEAREGQGSPGTGWGGERVHEGQGTLLGGLRWDGEKKTGAQDGRKKRRTQTRRPEEKQMSPSQQGFSRGLFVRYTFIHGASVLLPGFASRVV